MAGESVGVDGDGEYGDYGNPSTKGSVRNDEEGSPGLEEDPENSAYIGDMEGDEDDYAEEAEEMIRNIGQNPLMEPVQKALEKQLTLKKEQIGLEAKELHEQIRRAKKEREDVGVKLYGLQQHLAQLQLRLEETHNGCNESAAERNNAEVESRKNRVLLEEYKNEIKREKEALSKNQAEQNALNSAIRQVEQFNSEMKNEIAVTRRATYKAEENVAQMEKQKDTQDLLIDSLTEKVAQLQEDIGLFEAQRISQSKETIAAKETLTEASKEMTAIEFEKKQLLQQWKSSLIGIQRRDEALEAMRKSIHETEEAKIAVRAEIDGCKRTAKQHQMESEKLIEVKVRIENNMKSVNEQLKSVQKENAKLSEHYKIIKKNLESHDIESQRTHGVSQNLKKQEKTLANSIQAIEGERQKIERETAAMLGDKTTSDKASKNLSRESMKVQKVVHTKEIEVAQQENELARVRIDTLNTKAQVKQLQIQSEAVAEELKEKDKLIEKYQLEIRQRNDEIEKKMYTVDRLNRKYEQLTDGVEEENLGPLEATIKNLTKQTEAVKVESQELERQWLRIQTELVKIVNETEQENQVVHELISKETILQQKKLRLDSKIEIQEREVSTLNKEIEKMHNDMHKLNEIISENNEKHSELSNINFVIETDFIEELKELEEKSLQMEVKIDKAKQERDNNLEDIMESERQIKLWEKKIQLAKETQQALDPTVGQSETRAMEKEIHRMKIRYENLKREQEKMIKEMELAIVKRESIAVRNKTKSSLSQKNKPKRGRSMSGTEEIAMTHFDLKKGLKEKQEKTREIKQSYGRYEQAIKEKLHESENIGMELEKATQQFSSIEDEANNKQKVINDSLYKKQKCIDKCEKMCSMIQRYNQFKENPVMDDVNRDEVEIELGKTEEQLATLQDIISALSKDQPHLDEVLNRVAALID